MDTSVYKDTVTIANGETVSSAIALGGISKKEIRLFAIKTPAALTGTSFGVQVSVDGGTSYQTMYDDAGSAIAIAVGVDRYIVLDPATFAAAENIKLVSGSAEAAARTITLVLRSV